MRSATVDAVGHLQRAAIRRADLSLVARFAREMVVAVMCRRGTKPCSTRLNLCGAGPRTTSHTENVPNFARICLVNTNGVVSRRRAIVMASLVVVVAEATRIDEQSATFKRTLDRKRIRMRVARLVIRSDFAHVKKNGPGIAVPNNDAGSIEIPAANSTTEIQWSSELLAESQVLVRAP